MSTLDSFRERTGIMETGPLEITEDRVQEIVESLSELPPSQSRTSQISLQPVSTYVVEAKDIHAGSKHIAPNLPPFASHWGIVVDITIGNEVSSTLYHLILEEDRNGKRTVRFSCRLVEPTDRQTSIITGVGSTRYEHGQLVFIGRKMIEA